MPVWLQIDLNWLAALAGILVAHSLFLYSQFYRDSQGYMWCAAGKIWPLLLMLFGVEWFLAGFLFHLSLGLSRYAAAVPTHVMAGVIGIVVAAIPTSLESIFLPKTGATVKTVERPFTRLLLKLNVFLRHNYAWAIEYCKQQDLFDCQQPDGWGLGVPPVEVGRRIRKLYEFCKYKIAEERQDPSFLRYDVGRTPWDQFYLLTRHVGRKRLREYIKNPIAAHFPDWDGRERRRKVGKRSERDASKDTNPSMGRRYDDEALIKSLVGSRKRAKPPGPEFRKQLPDKKY